MKTNMKRNMEGQKETDKELKKKEKNKKEKGRREEERQINRHNSYLFVIPLKCFFYQQVTAEMFMQQFPYKSCQRGTPIRKSLLQKPKPAEEGKMFPRRKSVFPGRPGLTQPVIAQKSSRKAEQKHQQCLARVQDLKIVHSSMDSTLASHPAAPGSILGLSVPKFYLRNISWKNNLDVVGSS